MKQKSQDTQKTKNSAFIFGIHAALAALKNEKRAVYGGYVLRALYDEYQDLLKTCKNIQVVEKDFFKHKFGEIVHQGIALNVAPLGNQTLADLLEILPQKAIVVLLDQVTDPHNMGAILRASAAFSCHAIITTERHSPQDEGTIAKVASGALEFVPLIKETNLVSTIETLKKNDFWVYGLDERGEKLGTKNFFTERTAIVMGSEGKGLRRLVKESCDRLVALPTAPQFPTLNVSTAAAITLYEIHQQIGETSHA